MLAVFLLAARRLVRLKNRSSCCKANTCDVRLRQSLTMILHSFGPQSPLETPVSLGAQDTLFVSLTTKDNGKGKRPHQAFVLLKEEDTGLEAPFPLAIRDTGKGNVKIVSSTVTTYFRLPW